MLAKMFITNEIDDINQAVIELLEGIRSFKRLGNSCGLLFCTPDMDQDELVDSLCSQLDFDVIGCTAVATMDKDNGFQDMAISLLVFTSDQCEFSLGVSDIIEGSNVAEQVSRTYVNVTKKLSSKPKLIFAVPPYNLDTMLDDYLTAFDKITGGIPIIGGLPSHNDRDKGDRNLTIFNDKAYTDRLVIMAISGNIKPVFSVANVLGSSIERKRKVTLAKDNVIYRVGTQTFTDYLQEIGFDLQRHSRDTNTALFFANPILLEHVKLKDEDEFSFVRTLYDLSLEDGSGTSISRIPTGATLSICTMRRDEINQSAVKGTDELIRKMRENETDNYRYSTVLAISCMGRYLIMSPKNSIELDRLMDRLPKKMNLFGFYSHGELGPLTGNKSGLINFAHNQSLVLCAF